MDDSIEDAEFEDGGYYYDIYCPEADDTIMIGLSEVEVDAANTASYLEDWAKAQGWDVEIDWVQVQRNGKYVDRVALITGDDDPYLVLGQYYSQCQKRLREHMESQSA